MKKTLFYLLLFPIVIWSCQRSKTESTTVETTTEVVPENHTEVVEIQTDSREYFDYKNTILSEKINDTVYAKFSDDATDDCFTLNVEKGKITETTTSIRVFNKNGEVIYEHVFPTRELVYGYGTDIIKNDVEMEKYVIDLAHNILKDAFINPKKLSEDDFLSQPPKEEFEDYEAFSEIKNSNRTIFFYSLEEESLYYLGYSKKKNKTVRIINCC